MRHGPVLACRSGGSPAALRAQTDGTAARQTFVLESATTTVNVASPLVTANGTVYIGTRGNTLLKGRLWAISADNSSRSFVANDWIDATPTVGPDGTVYVGSWDGNLYALQDTGAAINKLWQYQTGSYIYSSAAIGPDGTIYFGSGDSNLHAIYPNGTLKWKYPVPDWVDSSPAVAPNGDIVFGCWDGRVYALNPLGSEKWHFDTGASVLSSPAIATDGTIYIGSTDNYLYALSPGGTKLWDYQTGADIESSPAIGAGGTIYIGSNDGYLYAIQPNGTLAWRTKIGASVASSPAIRADGSILVGVSTPAASSTPGQLVCLNSDGSVKWSYNAADIVDSSPAIGADNRIYFTDYARRLYTLNGVSSLASTVWPEWRREATHKARLPATGDLAQLVNISTRAQVGTGYNVMFAGTYIGGGTGKSVLARGVGPELLKYGVSGVLLDPALEVYNGSQVKIYENDDWDPSLATVFAQSGAFALDDGSKSAALVAPLSANNSFTFQVKGVNNSTGIAIVEVYDAQQDSGRLVNLSSRALVGTNDNVLIPGFYVKGTGAITLLIRAVGPTLAQDPYNVPGVLAQPNVQLVRSGTVVVANQVWNTAPNVSFIRDVTPKVGAFALPEGSADSVVLATVPPGGYTVIASGVNQTTGIALVELYVLTGY